MPAIIIRMEAWIGHEIDVALDLLEGPHDSESILHPSDIGEISGGSL